jgi:hypothetical protein
MTRALAALLCATLLGAGCGLLPEPTAEWDNGEMSFRYPATWTVSVSDESLQRRGPLVLAYVGSIPVDTSALCKRSANLTSCDYSSYGMAPGAVVVGIIRWSRPGPQLPDEGEHTEVGGRDARLVREATDRGTERLCYTIDDPYAPLLSICAEIQGPGEDRLRDQVEALIDSLEFTAPA